MPNRSESLRRRPAAFTLVELLVVIGIIAVLVGLLLPALTRAREKARQAQCLSKIHQILLAASVHATNHRGYCPLAGYLPGGSASDPALADPDRAKYDYLDTQMDGPGGDLAPITIALGLVMRAQYLIGATNDQNGQLETNGTLFIRNFLCPSQADAPGQILVPNAAYGGFPVLWAAPGACYTQQTSYVWNEYVLGWDVTDAAGRPVTTYPTRRLRGKLGRVRLPQQTMLVADGLGSVGRADHTPGVGGYAFATVYDTGAVDAGGRMLTPVALSDALAGNALAGNPAAFDRVRHRGRINVGFVDGHGESRNVNAGDLGTVYIVAP